MHLDVGCNSIAVDGAIALFEALKYQQSIISLSLANKDCYKHKNKYGVACLYEYRIGTKGAIALG